jgi:hypothetical protein
MPLIQIVPRHLVNTHGKHRLITGIYPLFNHPGNGQLVDEKGGGMAEVEDQRVAQPVSSQIKSVVVFEGVVQFFIYIERLVKIVENFGPFLLGISCIQNDGFCRALIHFVKYSLKHERL